MVDTYKRTIIERLRSAGKYFPQIASVQLSSACKCPPSTARCVLPTASCRLPTDSIEGHQQGETKRDNPVFTESAAVKVRYILSRQSTRSRHNRAIGSVCSRMNCEAFRKA